MDPRTRTDLCLRRLDWMLSLPQTSLCKAPIKVITKNLFSFHLFLAILNELFKVVYNCRYSCLFATRLKRCSQASNSFCWETKKERVHNKKRRHHRRLLSLMDATHGSPCFPFCFHFAIDQCTEVGLMAHFCDGGQSSKNKKQKTKKFQWQKRLLMDDSFPTSTATLYHLWFVGLFCNLQWKAATVNKRIVDESSSHRNYNF